ncbi:MAG: histidinol-phosphatase [Candidatus Zixiibacteriota bacterium]|nr:MAG: histidinol-phosphatase [candidate division Zixibacteria bacterium]
MIKIGNYFEYTGCIHLHTTYSDGTKSIREVTDIASSLGLDYIMICDHMTLESRKDGNECFSNGTLVLIGYEHNDMEDCNHYLLFETDDVLPVQLTAKEYVAAGRQQGALGIIAHPDEIRPRLGRYPSYPWLDWNVDGYDGIEIWNQMSEWMENLKPYNQIKMVFSPRRILQSPTDRILMKWDELNVRRKVAGIGAIDAHGYPYRIGPLTITIFPYKVQFQSIRTHLLLADELSTDISKAKRQLYNAIRDCRAYVSNYRRGDASGFEFTAQQGSRTVIGGGRLDSCDDSRLIVRVPQKADISLIGNGQKLLESRGDYLEYRPQQRGLYRVEVRKRQRGWIFSNHIRIGM